MMPLVLHEHCLLFPAPLGASTEPTALIDASRWSSMRTLKWSSQKTRAGVSELLKIWRRKLLRSFCLERVDYCFSWSVYENQIRLQFTKQIFQVWQLHVISWSTWAILQTNNCIIYFLVEALLGNHRISSRYDWWHAATIFFVLFWCIEWHFALWHVDVIDIFTDVTRRPRIKPGQH